MSERLRREADSGLVRGWMLLPVTERNAIFADLCLRSRLPDSVHFEVDWGKTPVPAPCLRLWVGSLSGRSAVNGVWALVLPMLLNLEGRGVIPRGWCEDESGILYGYVESVMRGDPCFDPGRRVPFVFYLTRRLAGNCHTRRRVERAQASRYSGPGEGGFDSFAGRDMSDMDSEVDASDLDGLLRALPDAPLRERVIRSVGGERVRFRSGDVEEVRRAMFSAR